MVGYIKKWKFPLDYPILERAHETFELLCPQEAGNIINDSWMIINAGFSEDFGKYPVGDYVPIIDLKFVDIFATDIIYEDNCNFKKINTEIKFFNNESIKLNIYETTNIRVSEWNIIKS